MQILLTIAPLILGAAIIFSGILFLVFLLLFFRSVNKRERVIKTERDFFENLIDSLEDGAIFINRENKMTVINKTSESLLEIQRADTLGLDIEAEILEREKFRTLRQVLTPALASSFRILSKSEDREEIVEILIKEPREKTFLVTSLPIYAAGTADRIGYLKIIRDISREKALERVRSEFITIAAHQLRTPLAAIKWSLKMLLDEDLGGISGEQKDILQKGYDSNDRMIQLVSELLDAARIEEGRFGYEFIETDFISFMEDVVNNLKKQAEEAGVKLFLRKPKESIRPIKFDPNKLRLVVENLIDNAIRYTLSGGQIDVMIEKDPSFIKVKIEDTGVGIPAHQLSRLFTKFFRGENVMRLQTEGSGLGLFISKNIIEGHNGEIWAESQEGKGSSFYFTIPIESQMTSKKGVSFGKIV
ncbi:MAG: hypothetical protein HYV52_02145 [Parcubacteria group bacterium]|nr:hypothetical protein [Parcubacteria group bacterium]